MTLNSLDAFAFFPDTDTPVAASSISEFGNQHASMGVPNIAHLSNLQCAHEFVEVLVGNKCTHSPPHITIGT